MSDLYVSLAVTLPCALFFGAWILLVTRACQGRPMIAYDFRTEPPWGFLDVLVVFSFLFIPQIGVAMIFQPLMTPGNRPEVVLKEVLRANTLISTISLFAIVAYLQLRPRASLADVGVSLRKMSRQVGLGLACFLLVVPITYAIQFVFVHLFGIPSEHPLIELVKKDASAFWMCAYLAVFLAPITEEILFRGLLQGWLERSPLFEADMEAMVLGTRQTDDEDDVLFHESKGGFHPVAWGPIIVSSLLFAGMHFSHGPDPIALFFLALALGYIYQRTHRLLPCIIVHMCLNASTMIMLWASLQTPG